MRLQDGQDYIKLDSIMKIMNRNEEDINALTHKIIGCAMQVHRILGNGFQEVIYQRALAIEFSFQNISFNREMEMDLFYREQHIGTRRVDFFCRKQSNG